MRLHRATNCVSRVQGANNNRHGDLSNAALSARRYALPSLSSPKS